MSRVQTGVGPTCRPLNAGTPTGAACIVVLAKRTYVLNAYGATGEPAPEQLPLRPAASFDGDANGLLLADTEAWPYKVRPDVVVHGHVYAYGTSRRVDAAVVVGAARRELRVTGDRRCLRSVDGHVRFSEPEPFERMPLGYDRAYGGYDHGSEALHPNFFEAIGESLPTGADPKTYSPCAYPRNRHGRGYYLSRSTTPLEEVLLPNIEEPTDLLTPERFVVPDPLSWWRQPLPAGTTWLHAGYFARCVYLGVRPFWQPLPEALPEVMRGYLAPGVRNIDLQQEASWAFGVQNGASLGLQIPGLTSGHTIRLIGLHPEQRQLDVVIPAAPQISIRTRWQNAEAAASVVLHHAELRPDDGIMTIVWRAAVDARRPLLPDELEALPLSVRWQS
jgi:hypothetical protein